MGDRVTCPGCSKSLTVAAEPALEIDPGAAADLEQGNPVLPPVTPRRAAVAGAADWAGTRPLLLVGAILGGVGVFLALVYVIARATT